MTQFGSKQQNIYGTPESNRRKVTLTCTYEASLEDIWHLWTTKAGLESWWGRKALRRKCANSISVLEASCSTQ